MDNAPSNNARRDGVFRVRGEDLQARYRRPQPGDPENAQARQRPPYFMPNDDEIINWIAGGLVQARPVPHHPYQQVNARCHAEDESDRCQGQLIIANGVSRRQRT